MIAQPQHFREREAFERGIAHPLAQLGLAAGPLHDLATFGGGSPVTPQQRGADHGAALVEEHRGVHLTRDPDRGDTRARALLQHAPDGRGARVPPRLGILLRPAGARRVERERNGRGGGDGSRWVHENGLHPARADVQPEEQRVVRLSAHPAAAPS